MHDQIGRSAPLFGFAPRGEVNWAVSTLRAAVRADEHGLDLFSVSDQPYYGHRLDSVSTTGVVLGATSSITVFSNVIILPLRHAPMLARTSTFMAELSGGRYVLDIGAGKICYQIVTLEVRRRSAGQAVRALREAITLVRKLSSGEDPVTMDGEFYQVTALEPATTPAPRIWAGSAGPKSLVVTVVLGDGWLPPGGADWRSPTYRHGRDVIASSAADADSDLSDFTVIFKVRAELVNRTRPSIRDEHGRLVGGSVNQWIGELTTAVLEDGAGGFVLNVYDDEPFDDVLGPWAQEIAPAVREAVQTS